MDSIVLLCEADTPQDISTASFFFTIFITYNTLQLRMVNSKRNIFNKADLMHMPKSHPQKIINTVVY